jgi:protein phosphatase
VRQQVSQLRRSLRALAKEGFRHIFVLNSPEDVEAATVERVPLYNDKRQEHGPFDIIGDVHGCGEELEAFLKRLGYVATSLPNDDPIWGNRAYAHPEGRKAVFLGDLVDRGPRILDVVRLVRNMVQMGLALCLPGNHDMKLMRKLRGRTSRSRMGWLSHSPRSRPCPRRFASPFAVNWPSSSMGWSVIMSSTAANWWSPTPG